MLVVVIVVLVVLVVVVVVVVIVVRIISFSFVPAGSRSRGGDVVACVYDIK